MEILNLTPQQALNGLLELSTKEVEKELIKGQQNQQDVIVINQIGSNKVVNAPPVLDTPKEAVVDFVIALMEAQSKMNQQQLEFSKNDIEAASLKNEAVHAQRISALEETIEKMEQANKGGLFAKIFGWIAAIAGLIVGAVATVVSGGAAAPILAAAALTLTQQITAECGVSLTGEIAKLLEPLVGEKAAQMIADIAFAVAIIALSCGSGISSAISNASKTALNMVKSLMNAGINAAKSSANLIKATSNMIDDVAVAAAKTLMKQSKNVTTTTTHSTSKITQTADIIGQGAKFTSGVALVGQGTSQIISTEAKYDADLYRADAKELAGLLAKMQAIMNENTERIQEILDRLQNSASNVMAILNSNVQSNQLINNNIRA
ncbi:type III secretion system translocon subunit SctE [Vibrio sp. TBV020]|uniref:type III secretion system translocon subunit SctE n=1 Tax=Vibrio sp. TBV020 TaxID=3137398 RepID=UPI0038CD5B63